MFNWFYHFNISVAIEDVRNFYFLQELKFPEVFMYSFPNAAWVFFGSCIILLIWRFNYSHWLFFSHSQESPLSAFNSLD
jgi:hypothetical protein